MKGGLPRFGGRPRLREDLFSFLLAYLGFLSEDLDWLQSSQVGRGQQGKDGLIQAGTLSQAVLLGDSVEGSEVEPICVRLHVCLCEVCAVPPSAIIKETLCSFSTLMCVSNHLCFELLS